MKRIFPILLLMLAPAIYGQAHQNALSWSSPSSGPAPTGYNVYTYAGACPSTISISTATKLTATPITTLTFTDSRSVLTNGSVNCYFETSLANGNESAASATEQLTTPLLTAQVVPDPPQTSGATTQ